MSADLRPVPPDDPNLDLGFGSVVARESRKRLLNRDGTFNVRREGLGYWEALSTYHYLLTISWPKFLGYVAATYIVLNALFAAAFVACGSDALTGFGNEALTERLIPAFFFSVDSMATIGYGNVVPVTVVANALVAFESLVGLLGFAILAGIMFARFARPRPRKRSGRVRIAGRPARLRHHRRNHVRAIRAAAGGDRVQRSGGGRAVS